MILVYYSKWLCLGVGAPSGSWLLGGREEVHWNAVNYSTGGVRRINAEINTVVVGLNWMPFRVGIQWHPWLRFKLDEGVRQSQWRRCVCWNAPSNDSACGSHRSRSEIVSFLLPFLAPIPPSLAFQSPQTITRIKVEDVFFLLLSSFFIFIPCDFSWS